MNRWYIPASIICLAALVPFFAVYERRRHLAAELTLTAVFTAAAALSRAAFYALPQIKPIAAVCVIAGAAFGAHMGFMCGALSMLVSNIIFGQGPWTPFQMLGLGLAALICSLVFRNKKLRNSRIALGIIPAVTVFAVYGFITDLQSVLFYVTEPSRKAVLAVFAAGVPFNAIFGVTTGIITGLIGKNAIERLERIKIKYGLGSKDQAEEIQATGSSQQATGSSQ